MKNVAKKVAAVTKSTSTKKVAPKKSIALASIIKTIHQLVSKKQGFYTKGRIAAATKLGRSEVKQAVSAMWGKQITKKRKDGNYAGGYILKTAK